MTDWFSIGITVFFAIIGIIVTIFIAWWYSTKPKIMEKDTQITKITENKQITQVAENVKGPTFQAEKMYIDASSTNIQPETKPKAQKIVIIKPSKKSSKRSLISHIEAGGYMDKKSNDEFYDDLIGLEKKKTKEQIKNDNGNKKNEPIKFDFTLKPCSFSRRATNSSKSGFGRNMHTASLRSVMCLNSGLYFSICLKINFRIFFVFMPSWACFSIVSAMFSAVFLSTPIRLHVLTIFHFSNGCLRPSTFVT